MYLSQYATQVAPQLQGCVLLRSLTSFHSTKLSYMRRSAALCLEAGSFQPTRTKEYPRGGDILTVMLDRDCLCVAGFGVRRWSTNCGVAVRLVHWTPRPPRKSLFRSPLAHFNVYRSPLVEKTPTVGHFLALLYRIPNGPTNACLCEGVWVTRSIAHMLS